MECVNCGTKLKRGQKICPHCGDYAILASMVKKLSVKCYNEGLKQAKNRELTNACISLEKSIKYDKENIDARNLLGLVLFEKGRYGEALEQWKISYHLKGDGNIAADYLLDILGNTRLMKKLAETSKMYNEALELLKKENDDLAAIRIKKLIDTNQKAIDAYNLYILLLIKLDKKAEAYSMCKRVLSMDAENSITLEYLRYVRNEKKVSKKKIKINKDRHVQVNESLIITPVAFIGGVFCALAVMFALVIPSIENDYQNKYDVLNAQYKQAQEEHNQFVIKSDEEEQKLISENENLKSKLYTSGEQELQQKITALASVQKEFDEGNVETAAESLLAVDTKGFTEEVQKQYERLKSLVLPAAAQKYYESGKNQVNSGNYDRAVTYFEKCIKCTADGDEIRYSAMYQMGKLADKQGDSQKAMQYFAEVAEKHPLQSIKNEAQNYLNSGEIANNDLTADNSYGDYQNTDNTNTAPNTENTNNSYSDASYQYTDDSYDDNDNSDYGSIDTSQ